MNISINKLNKRLEQAFEIYRSCELCPNLCRVNRLSGETGVCGQTSELKIAAAVPHFGEEPTLNGETGVGNIFFTGCSLSCVYCQNYQASQLNYGNMISPEKLAEKMLEFQRLRLNAVGWVTPNHFVPGLIKTYAYALESGFCLPIIYNTNSYEMIGTLRLLEGIVDVYLADLRYADDDHAQKYSAAENYVEISRTALEEMLNQVGPFCIEDNRMTGVIIRVLLLPNNIANIWETLSYIALEISTEIPISLMSQYQPVYRADEFNELNRFITPAEYQTAIEMVKELDFETIYVQDLDPAKHLLPDFRRKNDPFGKRKVKR